MPDPAPSSVDFGFLVGLEPKDAVAYLRGKEVPDIGRGLAAGLAGGQRHCLHRRPHDPLPAARADQADRRRHAGAGQDRQGSRGRDGVRLPRCGVVGKRVITDSAGQAQMVQLGSPWRIRTIINTNAHTAYNAGWNHRQLELAPERPYWRYTAVLDGSTRQSHRELDGQIFDAEAPVWRTIYPPNGFNCRCRVRALSRQQMERSGLAANRDGAVTDIEDVDDYGVITPRRRASWVDAGGKKRDFTPRSRVELQPGPGSRSRGLTPFRRQSQDGAANLEGTMGLADACDMPRSPTPAELPRAGSRFAAISAVEEALGLSDATPRLPAAHTGGDGVAGPKAGASRHREVR